MGFELGSPFLTALNRNLLDSEALAGALPANLRAAASVYSQAQVDAFLAAFDQVDNTSDADKPISTATQAALDLKLSTTALTGAPLTTDGFASYLTLSAGGDFLRAKMLMKSPWDEGATGVDASDLAKAQDLVTALTATATDAQKIANTARVQGRIFVGAAALINGTRDPSTVEQKTWVGNNHDGYMTYLEVRSHLAVFSANGEVAGAFATRSSDLEAAPAGTPTIALASFADNDSLEGDRFAWGRYTHVVSSQPNAGTVCDETDICSLTDLVQVNPYLMGVSGFTTNQWLGVGGETASGRIAAGHGDQLKNVSAAITIINQASAAAGNRFAKGIVFHSVALAGTDGADGGFATAIEMARGQSLVWKYGADEGDMAGFIRVNNNAKATQQRLVFEAGATQIKGVQSDFNTETILFNVAVPTLTSGQDVTGLLVNPAPWSSGTGNILLSPIGPATNAEFAIRPKGAASVLAQDQNGVTKLEINAAGIGFLGTSPSTKSGWAVDTGTAKRTANATYSETAEVAYTQATIQTLMDAVRDATQTIKAIKDDLHQTAGYGILRT